MVICMNRLFIIEYIKKLTKEDILRYGIKQDIVLTKDELDIIYNYIKNKYQDIFDNPIKVISEIKGNVRDNVYNKILELYDKYKNYIK